MFQFQRLAASAALSGALVLCGCSSNRSATATAPASSRPVAVQSFVAPSEDEPNSSTQSLPAQAPQVQQLPDATVNVEIEVPESNSATPMESTTQTDARQNQREDAINRREEFARNREMQQQQARQQAERQDAAQRAIWDRVDRNEAQRRDSEAAAVRQLDENRRNRELEASQRSIERQEAEKRDIASSGSGDGFDHFRMDTRDNRIENERRRMSENQ